MTFFPFELTPTNKKAREVSVPRAFFFWFTTELIGLTCLRRRSQASIYASAVEFQEVGRVIARSRKLGL